jgi:hypothetical protein
MANILICPPPPSPMLVPRAVRLANLLRPDPKEVWQDDAVGSPARLMSILASRCHRHDFSGQIARPATDASWTITGGAAGYSDV